MEHKRGREENFNVSVGKIAPKNIRFDSLFESMSSFFKNWRMEHFDAFAKGEFLMGLGAI